VLAQLADIFRGPHEGKRHHVDARSSQSARSARSFFRRATGELIWTPGRLMPWLSLTSPPESHLAADRHTVALDRLHLHRAVGEQHVIARL
jgi:hypothetical protein